MILEELAALTRNRVAEEKKKIPADEMRRMAESLPVTGTVSLWESASDTGALLYLRGEEGISIQGSDRAGFSVPADRTGI